MTLPSYCQVIYLHLGHVLQHKCYFNAHSDSTVFTGAQVLLNWNRPMLYACRITFAVHHSEVYCVFWSTWHVFHGSGVGQRGSRSR